MYMKMCSAYYLTNIDKRDFKENLLSVIKNLLI